MTKWCVVECDAYERKGYPEKFLCFVDKDGNIEKVTFNSILGALNVMWKLNDFIEETEQCKSYKVEPEDYILDSTKHK